MPALNKRSRKRKQPEPAATEWYSIRRILDERQIADNRVEYLVDWENDPNTGKSYEPTWAKSIDVTDVAIHEWKRLKASYDSQQDSSHTATSTGSADQSDQSPRPANFRKIQRIKLHCRPRSLSSSSNAETAPARKRPRYSLSPSTDEPVPSIASTLSPSAASELADIPESLQLVVAIPKPSDFDRTDYFSLVGSQSTTQPSQSVAELEEQDQVFALSSQISRPTIPDSQEYSAQSLSTASYQRAAQSLPASQANSSYPAIAGSLHPQESPAAGKRDAGNTEERVLESSIRSTLSRVNSVIPSGQQDPTRDPIVDILNTTGSHSTSIADSLSQSAAFQSQVEIDFSLSGSPVPERSSPSPSQGHASAALRASQDAQILSSFSGASLDKITDSNKTDKAPGADSNPLPSRRSPSVISLHSRPRSASAYSMESAGGGQGDSAQTQRSAVDELRDILTLTPISGKKGPASSALPSAAGSGNVESIGQPLATQDSPLADRIDSSTWQPVLQSPVIDSAGSLDPISISSALAPDVEVQLNSQMLVPGHASDEQPNVISPADTLQAASAVEDELGANSALLNPLEATSEAVLDSSADFLPPGQEPPHSSLSSATSDDARIMQHIITLPLQASLRPQYDDILLSHRKQVKDFSEAFSREDYIEPDAALVDKIDSLLVSLRNLCDYPQDLIGTSLETIPPKQKVKYACDANSKFSFVSELLQGIDTDTRVLIIAQSEDLLRLLGNVASSLDIDCEAKALKKLTTEWQESACHVTLALPDQELDIAGFEVVIGFDYTFGGSPVARALSAEGQALRPPLLLTLVTTHTIEHIDQQMSRELHPLERRNALLSGIVNARRLIIDPDQDYLEPHKIARTFCDFLKGASDIVFWNPVVLPEDVLDVYESSQVAIHLPSVIEGGRKRKLDDENEANAKRARMVPMEATAGKEEVPLPDDVIWLLESVADAGRSLPGQNVKIQVSLSVLLALAEKTSELKRQADANDLETQYKSTIDVLDTRVKEYERTSRRTYRAYREAIEERAKFERQKMEADTALESAQAAAEKESGKLQAKISELEATVTRLTMSGENGEESPVGVLEKLYSEAEKRIRELESRLVNARQDGEYAKDAYQEASKATTALQKEMREVREANEKLLTRASETVAKVHEIQAGSMTGALVRQVEMLKSVVREREFELDRVRDELRLARSSRRDFRPGSAPRSPRAGLMSPRAGARVGNGNGSGSGNGNGNGNGLTVAPASRGVSPAGREGSAMVGAVSSFGNGNGNGNGNGR